MTDPIESESDKIIKYCIVLHETGVDSPQAKKYRAQYKDDPIFQRRAKGAERLYSRKDAVLAELARMPESDDRSARHAR